MGHRYPCRSRRPPDRRKRARQASLVHPRHDRSLRRHEAGHRAAARGPRRAVGAGRCGGNRARRGTRGRSGTDLGVGQVAEDVGNRRRRGRRRGARGGSILRGAGPLRQQPCQAAVPQCGLPDSGCVAAERRCQDCRADLRRRSRGGDRRARGGLAALFFAPSGASVQVAPSVGRANGVVVQKTW